MPIDISTFDRCNILVVGDLMLDEYLWGEVDRISPEAPVQVVSIKKEDYTMGGAGNVVNNIVALGAKVSAAGVIGSGKNGQILLNKFKELGVDTAGIVQEPGRTTTKKTRIIASHQHVLRIDRETDKAISDPTLEKVTRFIEDKIAHVDVVLISDYGKGLITKTLLSGLILAAQKHKKVTIADPKGLDFSKYSGVSLLTPNKKEAALASGVEIVDESTLVKAGNKILQTVALDKLLITCGKDGMVLFDQNEEPCKVRTKARQVYDVSGAGDTVLSVFGLAIASGASFKDAMSIANTAAGIVVGKVGTATILRQELNARVVLTNGCFDLLHAGHIKLLSASKELGDILIVAIDDDDSVKKLKGSGRPVIGVKERVGILCALDSVDYVVVFSSRELKKLIEIMRPDVLTKGSNYTSEEVFGRERVEALGGKVVLIPVSENISSTRIINNIKSSNTAV